MIKPRGYSYTADALRIVAIVGVIAIHISGSFVDYPPYFHGASWWFANCIDAASRAAVPLFVMLSGALLLQERKGESAQEYFAKRLKRVGIPLLVWSVAYIAWQYFYWFKKLSLLQILTGFLAGSIYYHLYFLYLILGLYMLVPFLRILVLHISKNYLKYTLIFGFAFVIILFVLNAFLPSVGISFNGLTLFLPYTPYFLAGYYFRGKSISKKIFFTLLACFAALIFLTAVGNFWYMKAIGWSNQFSNFLRYDRYFYEYFSPNVIAMSLLGFVLFENIPLLFPWVKDVLLKSFVGIVTPVVFGMYLIHPMVIDVLERYFPLFSLAHIGGKTIFLMLVAKIAVVLVVSFLLVFLLRKIKLLRFAFG